MLTASSACPRPRPHRSVAGMTQRPGGGSDDRGPNLRAPRARGGLRRIASLTEHLRSLSRRGSEFTAA